MAMPSPTASVPRRELVRVFMMNLRLPQALKQRELVVVPGQPVIEQHSAGVSGIWIEDPVEAVLYALVDEVRDVRVLPQLVVLRRGRAGRVVTAELAGDDREALPDEVPVQRVPDRRHVGRIAGVGEVVHDRDARTVG